MRAKALSVNNEWLAGRTLIQTWSAAPSLFLRPRPGTSRFQTSPSQKWQDRKPPFVVINNHVSRVGWQGNVIPVRHRILLAICHAKRKRQSTCHRVFDLLSGHGTILDHGVASRKPVLDKRLFSLLFPSGFGRFCSLEPSTGLDNFDQSAQLFLIWRVINDDGLIL